MHDLQCIILTLSTDKVIGGPYIWEGPPILSPMDNDGAFDSAPGNCLTVTVGNRMERSPNSGIRTTSGRDGSVGENVLSLQIHHVGSFCFARMRVACSAVQLL